MRLSRQSYLNKMADAGWTPGWEAITEAFAAVYGTAGEYLPIEQFADCHSSLEGFGVYRSPKQYLHIVTRGLSRIHPHVDAYGRDTSGWGFELTVKWPGETWTECVDAFRIMDRLASFVDIKKIGFSPLKRIWWDCNPLSEADFSRYGAELVTLPDTEVGAINTVHGLVSFLQIVNISEGDVKKLSEVPLRIAHLLSRMKAENRSIPFHLPSPRDYFTMSAALYTRKDTTHVD